jgi:hypothetical protein
MSKPIQRSRGVRGSRKVIRGGSDDDDDAPNNRDVVERLMKTQVAASTRNAYLQKQVQFIALLFESFGLGEGSVLRQSFFRRLPAVFCHEQGVARLSEEEVGVVCSQRPAFGSFTAHGSAAWRNDLEAL